MILLLFSRKPFHAKFPLQLYFQNFYLLLMKLKPYVHVTYEITFSFVILM
jgi:hypothetical protein